VGARDLLGFPFGRKFETTDFSIDGLATLAHNMAFSLKSRKAYPPQLAPPFFS